MNFFLAISKFISAHALINILCPTLSSLVLWEAINIDVFIKASACHAFIAKKKNASVKFNFLLTLAPAILIMLHVFHRADDDGLQRRSLTWTTMINSSSGWKTSLSTIRLIRNWYWHAWYARDSSCHQFACCFLINCQTRELSTALSAVGCYHSGHSLVSLIFFESDNSGF